MAKRIGFIALASSLVVVLGAASSWADARDTPSVHFWSGGGAARMDWLATSDQPPGDTDNLAMTLVTTSAPNGFAGLEVMHVSGQPTATFPNSSFDVKTTDYTGPSSGSPRLEIRFSDGGVGRLRPLTLSSTWQTVGDPNWENVGGNPCVQHFQMTWNEIQACHLNTVVTSVVFLGDPYDRTHLVDDLTVDGVNITHAYANGNGGS